MKRDKTSDESAEKSQAPAYRIRLPGFITEEGVGLGDVIKRVTYRMGIQPCSGCERRASALNRWIIFSNRSR